MATFSENNNMQIRTRLTLQFLLIGAVIMILASFSIYFFSARYRQQAFMERLMAKARITSNLLLEANLNASMIEQLERSNPNKLNSEKIIILNSNDDIIFTTDYKNEIKLRYDVLESIRSGRQVFYQQEEYEIMGSLYRLSVNERFLVLAGAIDNEGKHHLEQLRIILLIVCLISIIIITVAGWMYSGRALKPISDVIKRVEEISVTSLNLRIDEGNAKDEIGKLAATFNKMLSRLEKSFTMQKDFIANASHELRTPLTAINGQLEVLSLKDRTNDEYKTEIKSVLEDTRRIIDLANRLLLIARTSAEGPISFNSNVRVDEILWQTRDELLRFNKNFHINSNIDESVEDESQMTITGDESLLKVAFSNLIENGCKYSNNHTTNVGLNSSANTFRVTFKDNGIGIPEDEKLKVFEPFYRSRNAKTYPGTGIGLSIVKQIIENHNGNIELMSEAGSGTEITVTFHLSRISET
ncbi:MAG TPA: HAMP domain-containing sensor histidine kinase [Bacteroidales bacterium]|nr:HAMP domain-containing sensor histidine kinase [Bacteroidales bacterium]